MSKTAKGSRPREELLPISEAARLVGLSVWSLYSFSKRGIIQPVYLPKNRVQHFRIHDLSALAEILSKRRDNKIDFLSVANMAMQAYVTARSNARRLDDLYALLGFDKRDLGTTEEEVIATYVRADEVHKKRNIADHELIQEWAEIVYSIDESYLALVEKHTASDEPWKAFLDAADHLIYSVASEAIPLSPPLQSAHEYLKVARTNLRNVAYHYCRSKLGPPTANRIFNAPSDPVEDVCRLLPSRLRKVPRAG